MNEMEIRDRLIKRGSDIFHSPKEPISLAKHPAADALLNDLAGHPHAFVLACVMNRQIKVEKAWRIPYLISQKLDGFSIEVLARLSREEVQEKIARPEPLHRFVETMSQSFYSAVQRIMKHYAGDAARIWTGKPSSAEVVYRFLGFEGVGPKIATMATNILARRFKIPLADYVSVDISSDVHVRRVFSRLGLCPADATVEQVIYKARALCPDFPGIMDSPSWHIGREWCVGQNPKCHACYMNDLCPTAVDRRLTL
jgi:endonuclease-3